MPRVKLVPAVDGAYNDMTPPNISHDTATRATKNFNDIITSGKSGNSDNQSKDVNNNESISTNRTSIVEGSFDFEKPRSWPTVQPQDITQDNPLFGPVQPLLARTATTPLKNPSHDGNNEPMFDFTNAPDEFHVVKGECRGALRDAETPKAAIPPVGQRRIARATGPGGRRFALSPTPGDHRSPAQSRPGSGFAGVSPTSPARRTTGGLHLPAKPSPLSQQEITMTDDDDEAETGSVVSDSDSRTSFEKHVEQSLRDELDTPGGGQGTKKPSPKPADQLSGAELLKQNEQLRQENRKMKLAEELVGNLRTRVKGLENEKLDFTRQNLVNEEAETKLRNLKHSVTRAVMEREEALQKARRVKIDSDEVIAAKDSEIERLTESLAANAKRGGKRELIAMREEVAKKNKELDHMRLAGQEEIQQVRQRVAELERALENTKGHLNQTRIESFNESSRLQIELEGTKGELETMARENEELKATAGSDLANFKDLGQKEVDQIRAQHIAEKDDLRASAEAQLKAKESENEELKATVGSDLANFKDLAQKEVDQIRAQHIAEKEDLRTSAEAQLKAKESENEELKATAGRDFDGFKELAQKEMNQIRNQLKAKESENEELRASAAKDAKRLQDQLDSKKTEWNRLWNATVEEVKQIRGQLEAREGEVKDYLGANKDLQQQLDSMKSDSTLEDLTRELDELKRKAKELDEENTNYHNLLAEKDTRIEALERDHKAGSKVSRDKENEGHEAAATEANAHIATLEKTIEKHELEIRQLKSEKQRLESTIGSNQLATEGINVELRNVKAELESTQSKLADSRRKLQVALEDAEQHRNESDGLRATCEELQLKTKDFDDNAEQMSSLQVSMEELWAQIATVEKEKKSAMLRVQQLEQEAEAAGLVVTGPSLHDELSKPSGQELTISAHMVTINEGPSQPPPGPSKLLTRKQLKNIELNAALSRVRFDSPIGGKAAQRLAMLRNAESTKDTKAPIESKLDLSKSLETTSDITESSTQGKKKATNERPAFSFSPIVTQDITPKSVEKKPTPAVQKTAAGTQTAPIGETVKVETIFLRAASRIPMTLTPTTGAIIALLVALFLFTMCSYIADYAAATSFRAAWDSANHLSNFDDVGVRSAHDAAGSVGIHWGVPSGGYMTYTMLSLAPGLGYGFSAINGLLGLILGAGAKEKAMFTLGSWLSDGGGLIG